MRFRARCREAQQRAQARRAIYGRAWKFQKWQFWKKSGARMVPSFEIGECADELKNRARREY